MLRWKDIIYYAKYSNPEPYRRVAFTEQEWAQQLTPEQYKVMRQHGTEPPYRNAFCNVYDPGTYVCAGCHSLLFNSTEKYRAISGWPSFTQPASKAALNYSFDDSHHMQRIAVCCNVCKSHLGHVFNDGPKPHGLRFCINSICLIKL